MKKFLTAAIITLLVIPSATFGQGCVTCTRTAENLGANSAHGLNAGILYLAALPLIFMIIVAIIWWKRNKAASTATDTI